MYFCSDVFMTCISKNGIFTIVIVIMVIDLEFGVLYVNIVFKEHNL